jgi:hypothetical protein
VLGNPIAVLPLECPWHSPILSLAGSLVQRAWEGGEMLILRSRRKYMVFTTLICSIALLMVTAVPAQAVVPYFWPNVLGTKTQNNYGAYSFIRVSNPTIRPGVNAWVYHRALGRRIQAGYGDTYIESGFTKNADTNQVMHFWVWADRNGATGWGTANHLGFPVVGQTYD